jgi:hypothetical protein
MTAYAGVFMGSIVDIREDQLAQNWTFWPGFIPRADETVSVSWKVYGGTALAGVDFVGYSGSAVIPAGGYRTKIADIIEDLELESPEHFFLEHTISGKDWSTHDTYTVVIGDCLTERDIRTFAGAWEVLESSQAQVNQVRSAISELKVRIDAMSEIQSTQQWAANLSAIEVLAALVGTAATLCVVLSPPGLVVGAGVAAGSTLIGAAATLSKSLMLSQAAGLDDAASAVSEGAGLVAGRVSDATEAVGGAVSGWRLASGALSIAVGKANLVMSGMEWAEHTNNAQKLGRTLDSLESELAALQAKLIAAQNAGLSVLNEAISKSVCDLDLDTFKLDTSYNLADYFRPFQQSSSFLAARADAIGSFPELKVVDPDGEIVLASVEGDRADFSIARDEAGTITLSKSGGQTVMASSQLKVLSFSDRAYNIEIASKANAIGDEELDDLVDLYVAYFNRVPEASGLGYWIDQYVAGKSLTAMAAEFYAAGIQFSDVTGYTADLPLSDFVRVLYANVLGRSGVSAPPQADVDYWVNEVATGAVTREGMVARFLGDARKFYDHPEVGWVPRLLDQKVEFGKLHAVTYGLDYNDSAKSIAETVKLAAAVTPAGFDAAVSLLGLSTDDYLA